MAFFDSSVDKILQGQFINSHIFLSTPKSTISAGGGALLKRFSPPAGNPTIETLGIVLTSPNVPRAFHPGFDPSAPDVFENDFFDKIVFVSADDYKRNDTNTRMIDIMSAGSMLFGRMMDEDSACGCSPGSPGTPIYQLKIGDVVSFAQLPDLYVVIAAAFVDDPSQGAVGPMTVSEYWIANYENRNLILDTPEFQAAKQRSRTASPPDCPSRRNRVLAQVERLRKAAPQQIFHPPAK